MLQDGAIADHHFFLHLDLATGQLMLTDTSRMGTLVRIRQAQRHSVLRQATMPIVEDTHRYRRAD